MNLGGTRRAEMTKEANNALVSKIKQLKAHYGITTEDDEDGEPQSPPFPRSSDLMPYNTETPTLHRTTVEKVGTPRNALIRRASTLGRMRSKTGAINAFGFVLGVPEDTESPGQSSTTSKDERGS
ncbi:hypothetical protein V2W45_596815 [Cenococcum geophilum]